MNSEMDNHTEGKRKKNSIILFSTPNLHRHITQQENFHTDHSGRTAAPGVNRQTIPVARPHLGLTTDHPGHTAPLGV